MKKVLNFLYNYQTPYGILPNGLSADNVYSIMKASISNYEAHRYVSDFKNYLETHKSLSYDSKIISPVFFRSDKYKKGLYNFFVIEDFNNLLIDISDNTITTLKQWNDFYIILINFGEDISLSKVEELKEFKSKYRINKNKIIYISDVKPESNIQWSYVNASKSDLTKDIILKKIDKKIQDINETKFI